MKLVAFHGLDWVGSQVYPRNTRCFSLSMAASRRSFIKQCVCSLSMWRLSGVESLVLAEPSYENYAKSYDELETSAWNGIFQLDLLRKELLTYISGGKVLEVAIGTGLNLEYYPWQYLTQFRGVDTSPGMLEQAENKLISLSKHYNVDWKLIEASVTCLPFPDNYFDYVVDTFSLCVFDHPRLALGEMRRVCKKSGKILLLEHSSSPYWLVRQYQQWTGNLVAKFAKGCNWSLPLQDLLQLEHFPTVYQKYSLLGTVSLHVVSK